uniref:Uncharacterized protein n=1 Tax=Oryza sativa subsp. japonica TaxID=39947 RepID=Q6ZKY5_ORYSJ|nr:hypothetical protein [Oryza sativa Japonica Group]
MSGGQPRRRLNACNLRRQAEMPIVAPPPTLLAWRRGRGGMDGEQRGGRGGGASLVGGRRQRRRAVDLEEDVVVVAVTMGRRRLAGSVFSLFGLGEEQPIGRDPFTPLLTEDKSTRRGRGRSEEARWTTDGRGSRWLQLEEVIDAAAAAALTQENEYK